MASEGAHVIATDVDVKGLESLPAELAIEKLPLDVTDVSAIRALVGDRLEIFVGVDDMIVEGIAVGATGWIAGLANALPRESVELFNCAMSGDREKTFKLYHWFLPLLRMDTPPNFVQLIKLVQAELGMGNPRVRGPRLELADKELAQVQKTIRDSLRTRPNLSNMPAIPVAR